MARTIRGYAAGAARWFVPKSFGNRADPMPVRIHIVQPTLGAKREADGTMNEAIELAGMENGKPVLRVDAKAATAGPRALVELCVDRVENYAAAGGAAIEDGKALWIHGEQEIIDEVVAEIRLETSLSEEEKKASAPPSVSPGIQSSPGTVEHAAPGGSPA